MSETTPEAPAPAQPAETAPAQPETAANPWESLFPGEDPAKVRETFDHARKWESRAKENFEAAQQWRTHQDSLKTEQERAAEEQAKTAKELDDLRSQNARLLAITTHNLSPEDAELLGDGTPEQIEARAALLAKRLATTPVGGPAVPATTRPVESLTPGAQPASSQPLSPDDWIRRAAGRG